MQLSLKVMFTDDSWRYTHF